MAAKDEPMGEEDVLECWKRMGGTEEDWKSKTEADPDFRQNFLGQFANAAKMARRGSPY